MKKKKYFILNFSFLFLYFVPALSIRIWISIESIKMGKKTRDFEQISFGNAYTDQTIKKFINGREFIFFKRNNQKKSRAVLGNYEIDIYLANNKITSQPLPGSNDKLTWSEVIIGNFDDDQLRELYFHLFDTPGNINSLDFFIENKELKYRFTDLDQYANIKSSAMRRYYTGYLFEKFLLFIFIIIGMSLSGVHLLIILIMITVKLIKKRIKIE